MNETPAHRQLTVIFMAGLLILTFFSVFAWFFLGQGPATRLALPGATWRSADDEPTGAVVVPAGPGKPAVRRATGVAAERGRWIPQTEAERAYFAAVEKARERKGRVVARRERREAVQSFIESPLGQNLQATFELARRGNADAAKKFLEGILEDLASMDSDVQRFVIQSAMSIYSHDKDRVGLAHMLDRYMRFVREAGAAGGEGRDKLDEWLSELQSQIPEIERRATK